MSEDKASQLPAPTGFHILCAVPQAEEKYESGLLKAEETQRYDRLLSTVLFVVAMGPECYANKERFPNGPWCKTGDFVLVRPNSGSRLVIHGKEFRLIYDDAVEAVVQDPRGIARK